MKIIVNMFLFIISSAVLLFVAAAAMLLTLPDVGKLETCFTTSMFEVKVCPGTPQYVPLSSISPFVVHAVIASEDAAFYSHQGFDWHEIQESFTTNLRSGKFRRGGSTLTQQLAKNAFLNKEKSLVRKAKEAYLAHAIERRFKKDFILEKYLNMVEFGPNIYGVKAASAHYFQKSPSELHPLEAAFLAFLLPNPKEYSKSYKRGALTPFARKQVRVILRRMASFGKLSAPGLEIALANLDLFPWRELTRDSFQGTPNYNLDATVITDLPPDLDEETLEEIIEEDEATANSADLEE